MKKIFSVIALVFTSFMVSAADSTFVINGTLSKIRSGKIFLTIFAGDNVQRDSSVIRAGKFSFKGAVKEPSFAVLNMASKTSDNLVFYIEPANMEISGSGDSMKILTIKGSALNEDDKLFKQRMLAISKWEETNQKLFEAASIVKNKAVLDSLDQVDNLILAEKRKVVSQFVKDYPHSTRSALAIADNYAYYAEAAEVEPVFNMLDDNLRSSAKGIQIKKMIAIFKTVALGMPAPDIQQVDTTNKIVRLSSLKGKYVLVDFWASWCGPCRRENPNIVKTYTRFKDKGFEIFGVSYDNKKEKWEKAIKDDKLVWYQVSDLKGWKNMTSDLYGIKAIPSNLLLDKEGKIVAKNLFGSKLSEKLTELLP